MDVLQHVMQALGEANMHRAALTDVAQRGMHELILEAARLRDEVLGEGAGSKLAAGLAFVWVDSPLVKAMQAGHWVSPNRPAAACIMNELQHSALVNCAQARLSGGSCTNRAHAAPCC